MGLDERLAVGGRVHLNVAVPPGGSSTAPGPQAPPCSYVTRAPAPRPAYAASYSAGAVTCASRRTRSIRSMVVSPLVAPRSRSRADRVSVCAPAVSSTRVSVCPQTTGSLAEGEAQFLGVCSVDTQEDVGGPRSRTSSWRLWELARTLRSYVPSCGTSTEKATARSEPVRSPPTW